MKTKYHSYKLGQLPKGCQLCVQGKKLVLFITGLCPRSCYFCPISDKKYKKDVIYADEWPTRNIKDIIKEAKLISAEGAGITGGDPLCKLERTLAYIRILKKTFGKKFHIHLYTSLDLITENNLKKLYTAGLDEIRFHLDFDSKKLWPKLTLPLAHKWDIGIEIPVIPKSQKQKVSEGLETKSQSKEKEIKNIILLINNINKNSDNKIKFLNLNELEVADNKVSQLSKLGYQTKNSLSYGVIGSEELALKLLKYCKGKIKNVHYCTAKLKDKVQLTNRIKRRAKNIKKDYDILTKEGTLIRGAIYLKSLKPGFNYRKKLEKINKNNYKKKIIKKN